MGINLMKEDILILSIWIIQETEEVRNFPRMKRHSSIKGNTGMEGGMGRACHIRRMR